MITRDRIEGTAKYMETETGKTDSAQGAAPKTKEVEVQWSIKWVNFSTTVEASSTEEAIDIALQLYK